MKSHFVFPIVIFAAVIALSQISLAHERQLFTIGGTDYLFVVGSLNEPIFVDDKTGVDLRVVRPNASDPMNTGAPGVVPVTGLEETLKVEISAGGKKKVLDLEPRFRDPGAYNAPFYPTVPTTLTYRFFGKINNVDVDISFVSGGSASSSDNTPKVISDTVTRKSQAGGFNTPEAREGFPEPYTSNFDQSRQLSGINSIQTQVSQLQAASAAAGIDMLGLGGLILGLIALIVAILAHRKPKQA